MDQLHLSFQEEILLHLKKTEWEFKTKPESLSTQNKIEKFIELDCNNMENKKPIAQQDKTLSREF